MGIFKTIVTVAAINATEKFAEGAVKHTSNAIADYMDKNKIRYVYTPQSSEDYVGMYYTEVQEELSAYGFENINLLEKKSLWNNWINKYRDGKVAEISINGKTDFKRKIKFKSDAQVVIVYHTYRK